MRRWAITRRPFSSKRALILPVRFRRVASGLMIEKVRSTAIKSSASVIPDEWAGLIDGGSVPGKPPGSSPERRQGLGQDAVQLRPRSAFRDLGLEINGGVGVGG